jgi:hypothetical protein
MNSLPTRPGDAAGGGVWPQAAAAQAASNPVAKAKFPPAPHCPRKAVKDIGFPLFWRPN